ncbi:MAG: hypothetical protein ACE365_03165 [Gammaproteobacteria bacterium]
MLSRVVFFRSQNTLNIINNPLSFRLRFYHAISNKLPLLPVLVQLENNMQQSSFLHDFSFCNVVSPVVQHATPSVIAYLKTLKEKGVDIHAYYKSYSAVPSMIELSENFNIPVQPFSLPNVPERFDSFFAGDIVNMIERQFHDRSFERLRYFIGLDEGGVLNLLFHFPEYFVEKYHMSYEMLEKVLQIKQHFKDRMCMVEQTARGMRIFDSHCSPDMPVIDFANACIKNTVEPKFTCDQFLPFVKEITKNLNMPVTYGIIGAHGSMGKIALNCLLDIGCQVVTNDIVDSPVKPEVYHEKDLRIFLNQVDVVFSFSGNDVFARENLDDDFLLSLTRQSPKCFVSFSSNNIEFLHAISRYRKLSSEVAASLDEDPFSDIEIGNLKILAGGYPYNLIKLRNDPESYDNPHFWQMTRALIKAAMEIQAPLLLQAQAPAGIYQLHYSIQQYIMLSCVKYWRQMEHRSVFTDAQLEEFEDKFRNIEYIRESSSGADVPEEVDEKLNRFFDQEKPSISMR